jgi:hypothetical protein
MYLSLSFCMSAPWPSKSFCLSIQLFLLCVILNLSVYCTFIHIS